MLNSFLVSNLFCPYFVFPESHHQGATNDQKRPEVSDSEGPADGRIEDGTGQTGSCFPSMSNCICLGSKQESSSFQTVSTAHYTNIKFP